MLAIAMVAFSLTTACDDDTDGSCASDCDADSDSDTDSDTDTDTDSDSDSDTDTDTDTDTEAEEACADTKNIFEDTWVNIYDPDESGCVLTTEFVDGECHTYAADLPWYENSCSWDGADLVGTGTELCSDDGFNCLVYDEVNDHLLDMLGDSVSITYEPYDG